MRLRTATRMWHRMGLIDHQLKEHRKLISRNLEQMGEIVDMVTLNANVSKNIAQFDVDMAGLLVDLMADVKELSDLTGHSEIGERIDARADIAGAMLQLRNEANK